MMRRESLRLVLVAGAGVVVAIAAWLLNAGFVSVLTPIVMYIALSEGWTILGGYGGAGVAVPRRPAPRALRREGDTQSSAGTSRTQILSISA